jgi:hypothetical protein
VFDDHPFAKQALEDSGLYSYGENSLSLVSRDKLIEGLEGLDIDDDDVQEEVDGAVEFLRELPVTVYIDLEDM